MLTGSRSRASGVTASDSDRRYSWQFWRQTPVSGYAGACAGWTAYPTEEVPHEDDEDAARGVAATVEALEGVRAAMAVEDDVVVDLANGFG